MTTYIVDFQIFRNNNTQGVATPLEFDNFEEAQATYNESVERLERATWYDFDEEARRNYLKYGDEYSYEVALGKVDDEDCETEWIRTDKIHISEKYANK